MTIGRQFLGAGYEARTLEKPGGEQLVVNLRTFDCVTFVENVLALARCVRRGTTSFEGFTSELRRIRYRGGAISGYPSRLHYFSEWIDDNEAKGVVRNTTSEIGGHRIEKPIDWMTKHRSAYRQLADTANFAMMVETEQRLSQRRVWFIPKDEVSSAENRLNNGDIIAMVSSIEGLDVGHVGIAVRMKDGSLGYMHAPNERGKVRITHESLEGYIARNRAFSGIMVARPIEPKSSEQTK